MASAVAPFQMLTLMLQMLAVEQYIILLLDPSHTLNWSREKWYLCLHFRLECPASSNTLSGIAVLSNSAKEESQRFCHWCIWLSEGYPEIRC